MSGHWDKIAGARAIYIPDRVSTRPEVQAPLGFGTTLPSLLTSQSQRQIFPKRTTNFRTISPINKLESRKRPASETILQIERKRPCNWATLHSGVRATSKIKPLDHIGVKLSQVKASLGSENSLSFALTFPEYYRGLNRSTMLGGFSVGSLRTLRNYNVSLKRKQFLDNIFEKIALDKNDIQRSKRFVGHILKSITSNFDRYQSSEIYRRQYIYAGSYPVKLKINKADEFDVNIPLNIDVKRVRTSGNVTYCFKDQRQSLHLDKKLFFNPQGTVIPSGYAVVDVEIFNGGRFNLSSLLRNKLPAKFLYIGLPISWQDSPYWYMNHSRKNVCVIGSMQKSNRSSSFFDCIELIPADIKKDLFEKVQLTTCFQNNQSKYVHISKVSNGPALTMTLKSFPGSSVNHDIKVDITVSLECDIPLSKFGWPREKTRQAFDSDHIDEVLKAGIHLVPKKDLFWAISFSKAERALLSRLDSDRGCRKYVTKIMKKFVMICSSQSTNGLPGISSHIIKTRILWSCEEHSDVPSYWCHDNRNVCLVKTLGELMKDLKSRRLPDYFNPCVNV